MKRSQLESKDIGAYLEEPVSKTSTPSISIRLGPLISSPGNRFPHKNINVLGHNIISIFRNLRLVILEMLVQQTREQFRRYLGIAGRHILFLICSCDLCKDVVWLLGE
jgi:hypothetical protein